MVNDPSEPRKPRQGAACSCPSILDHGPPSSAHLAGLTAKRRHRKPSAINRFMGRFDGVESRGYRTDSGSRNLSRSRATLRNSPAYSSQSCKSLVVVASPLRTFSMMSFPSVRHFFHAVERAAS